MVGVHEGTWKDEWVLGGSGQQEGSSAVLHRVVVSGAQVVGREQSVEFGLVRPQGRVARLLWRPTCAGNVKPYEETISQSQDSASYLEDGGVNDLIEQKSLKKGIAELWVCDK